MEPVAANQRPDRLYTTSNGRPYTLAPMSRQHRLIHARDDSIVSSRHGMAAKTDFFPSNAFMALARSFNMFYCMLQDGIN